MSSSIVRSFQNQLLFSCEPVLGKGFFHMSNVMQSSWTPNSCTIPVITLHASPNASPNGNPNNETASSQNLNGKHCLADVNTPTHQRGDNTVTSSVECNATSAYSVNLFICPEVTHYQEATHNGELPDHCDDIASVLSVSKCPEGEDSHSEYESDNESDECIEFSDESLLLSEEVPKPNCIKYVTLVSSESGYFECAPRQEDVESTTDDVWSDSDSDGEIEFCSEVWDSFEVQAFSPMIPCKVKPKGTQDPPNREDKDKQLITLKCPYKVIEDQRHQTDCNTITSTTKKQVSFKCDAELVEVHTIVAWEYAYRAARKGPWEQYARDRCHFRRRINSVSSVLEPCLLSKLSASQ